MQAGDVLATYADVDDLARDVGFRPATPLAVGLERFVAWYRDFYGAPDVTTARQPVEAKAGEALSDRKIVRA